MVPQETQGNRAALLAARKAGRQHAAVGRRHARIHPRRRRKDHPTCNNHRQKLVSPLRQISPSRLLRPRKAGRKPDATRPALTSSLLPPHDWNKVLATAWADKKKHSEHQWRQHATRAVHSAITDRQEHVPGNGHGAAQLRLVPLHRRADRARQTVAGQPTTSTTQAATAASTSQIRPRKAKRRSRSTVLEWPVTWFDWEFVNSVLDYGQAIGRWNREPRPQPDHLGQTVLGAAIPTAGEKSRRHPMPGSLRLPRLSQMGKLSPRSVPNAMEKPAPPQPNMLALLAATDAKEPHARPLSHPRNRSRSSPSQTRQAHRQFLRRKRLANATLHALHDRYGATHDIRLAYADTGNEYEDDPDGRWISAAHWCIQRSAYYGFPLTIVRNPKRTLQQEVVERNRFPSSGQRWCTATTSGARWRNTCAAWTPITSSRSRASGPTKATSRANQPPWEVHRKLTVKRTNKTGRARFCWNWLPILKWTFDDVLSYVGQHETAPAPHLPVPRPLQLRMVHLLHPKTYCGHVRAQPPGLRRVPRPGAGNTNFTMSPTRKFLPQIVAEYKAKGMQWTPQTEPYARRYQL